MILNAYKYLYFRIYSWNLRMWGESDLPQFNALFGVCFLVCLNVLSLVTVIELLTRTDIFSTASSKGMLFVIFGAVLVLSYVLLVFRSKYKTIFEEYNKESDMQRRARMILIILYVLLTFGSLYWLVELRNS